MPATAPMAKTTRKASTPTSERKTTSRIAQRAETHTQVIIPNHGSTPQQRSRLGSASAIRLLGGITLSCYLITYAVQQRHTLAYALHVSTMLVAMTAGAALELVLVATTRERGVLSIEKSLSAKQPI